MANKLTISSMCFVLILCPHSGAWEGMASLWTLSSQADAATESAAVLASTTRICAFLRLIFEMTEGDEDNRVLCINYTCGVDRLEVQGGWFLSGRALYGCCISGAET